MLLTQQQQKMPGEYIKKMMIVLWQKVSFTGFMFRSPRSSLELFRNNDGKKKNMLGRHVKGWAGTLQLRSFVNICKQLKVLFVCFFLQKMFSGIYEQKQREGLSMLYVYLYIYIYIYIDIYLCIYKYQLFVHI